MRKIHYLMLLCMFLSAGTINATQWSVSNSPANPGQYASIQAALNDPLVMPGDTLLIQPTPVRHPDFELTKRLVFIGGGHSPSHSPGQITTLSRVYITSQANAVAASGSKFHGLRLSYFRSYGFSGNISDIGFENVLFDCLHCPNESGIRFEAGIMPVNMLVKNCYFQSCIYDSPLYFSQTGPTGTASSLTVLNSVFSNCGGSSIRSFKGTLLVSNCTFLSPSPIYDVKYGAIQNCIFTTGTFDPNVTDNSFNNCIATDASLPPAGNLGANNISNTAVIFVPNTLMLDPSSPGYTGGNNGTQMGVYGGGGNYSSSGEPLNSPIIRNLNIKNITIAQNGNLTIDLLATKPLKTN